MEGPEDSVPCEDFATCGVAQFQNRQYPKNVKQQDSYFIVEDLAATFRAHLGKVSQVAIYGVADGHGEFGEVSANFIRRNLPPQLAQSQNFAAGNLDAAMLEAFAQTELLQESAGLPLYASGACVSAAAVSPSHIVVANCGDCRCVLVERGMARDLSQDHNVGSASPEELQRVLAAGGTITPDKRVTMAGAPGRLATTRSFGDYWAKPQGPPESHVITALPEVRMIERNSRQQYLLLASDGIFGFMSSQDAVSLSLSIARQLGTGPLSRIAHGLVCNAVHTRRSDDNCTCLIVDLSRIDGDFHGAQQPFDTLAPEMLVPQRWSNPQDAGYLEPEPALQQRELENSAFRHGLARQQQPGIEHQRPPQDPKGQSMSKSKEDSENSTLPSSSWTGLDEVCWCPWCKGMNPEGEAENMVLGTFERWRLHMHEQHFDKLGGVPYAADEIVPCYWCCKPCVTKKGQNKLSNRLPFWGSHERVCKENPSKPVLPGQAGSSEASQTSGSGDRWATGPAARSLRPIRGPTSPEREYRDLDYRDLRDFSIHSGLRNAQKLPERAMAGYGRAQRLRDGYNTPPTGGSDAGKLSSPEGKHVSASPPQARSGERGSALPDASRGQPQRRRPL